MFQILIAEDDMNTRRLMEAVLKEHGYHPILACDGLEALKLLDTHHVDLVILDIMMPGMDGYELTRQLRATDYTLPILMVTAKQLPEDKRKGFIVGTDDYMTKPVDEEEMILRIRALLRRAQIVNERRITIGDVCLDYDSLTVSRGDSTSSCPIPARYSPASSSWTRYGAWNPSRTTIPSMYTLTGCGSVLRTTLSLPSKPYAAWATRR